MVRRKRWSFCRVRVFIREILRGFDSFRKKSENVKIDDKGLMDNLKNFHSEWKHFKPEIGSKFF